MKVFAYLDKYNRTPENKVSAVDIKKLKERDPSQYYGRIYYSIHRNIENVQEMHHSNGQENPFFRYKADSNIDRSGINESKMHDTVKNVMMEMSEFTFKHGEKIIKIYADYTDIEHTEILDGKVYRNDVVIMFSKSDPPEYVENWNGKLTIEVIVSNILTEEKLNDYIKHRVAMFALTFKTDNRLYIDDSCDGDELLDKIQFVRNAFNKQIFGELVSNPLSELNELRLNNATLSSENHILKTRLKELVAENEALKSKLSSVSKQNETLLTYCKNFELNEPAYVQQIEGLTTTNRTLTNEITTVKELNTKLNAEFNALKNRKIIKFIQRFGTTSK